MADRTPVIGVFASGRQAGRAVHELRRAGFRGGQVKVIAGEKSGAAGKTRARVKRGTRTTESTPAEAVQQALQTADATQPAAGGPGRPPADVSPTVGGVVEGLLDSVRRAAATAADTVTGALAGLSLINGEAEFYEGEFRAGRTLVAVRVRRRRQEAAAVLHRCGAYDAAHPRQRGEDGAASRSS